MNTNLRVEIGPKEIEAENSRIEHRRIAYNTYVGKADYCNVAYAYDLHGTYAKGRFSALKPNKLCCRMSINVTIKSY